MMVAAWTDRPTFAGRLGAGVIAGLAAGVLFGALMHAWNMMTAVAQLGGGTSVAAGWVIHLLIAAGLGALFAALWGRWASSVLAGIGLGLSWGLLWWVLGGLLLMPLRLGADPFVLDEAAWRSLGGHLVYGVILGAVYAITPKNLHLPRSPSLSGPVDTVHGASGGPFDPSTRLPPDDHTVQ